MQIVKTAPQKSVPLKFLDKINPSAILIAETELWPNFFYCAKQKNIPLFIIILNHEL